MPALRKLRLVGSPEMISIDKVEFYAKLESLLKVPKGSIDGKRLLTSFSTWDSLTILEFMVLVDTDYKSDVQPTDIGACRTVDDLAELTYQQSGNDR